MDIVRVTMRMKVCVRVNEYKERIPMEKQVHCFVSALLYVEVTREYNWNEGREKESEKK